MKVDRLVSIIMTLLYKGRIGSGATTTSKAFMKAVENSLK